MANMKRYWSGLDELDQTDAFKSMENQEFPEAQTVDEFISDERHNESTTGRRDFLKFMGFSLTAATLAACETPVVKSIPYVNKPEEITPGVANYYASTYYDGVDYCNVLVKTREGRPIFVQGNNNSELGHANARVIGSVMSLYDSARLQGPIKNGAPTSWSDLDNAVRSSLGSGRTVVLSNTILSPSLKKAIASLGAEHVQYDAMSYNALRQAQSDAFGVNAVPSYDFSQAETIVSIAADFLNTWLTNTKIESQYAELRRPERTAKGAQSKHFQFESAMTMTGTNADVRTMVNPSDEGKVAAGILAAITGSAVVGLDEKTTARIKEAAKSLIENRGKSIVLAGSNDLNTQLLVAAINQSLSNYGTTLDLTNPSLAYQGDDSAVAQLVADMNAGKVSTLITLNCNPAYDLPNASEFISGMSKVKTSVSMSGIEDETAKLSSYIAPNHHYLESWNDLSLYSNRVDISQPTIAPLYDTRAAGESMLVWAGAPLTDWYTYIRTNYNSGYTSAGMYTDADWNSAVHDGYFSVDGAKQSPDYTAVINSAAASSAVAKRKGGAMQLTTYVKSAMGLGNHAANPMLQETPDPVSKVTWDNYITMSRSDMNALGLNTYIAQENFASVVRVTSNGHSIELPAFMQPGQKPGTIAVALGYGRGANGENIGKAGYQTGENGEHLEGANGLPMPIGANAFPFTSRGNYDVTIEVTGAEYPLACTQIHNTVMDRDSVVKETTLAEYKKEKHKSKGKASWNTVIGLNVHEDVNGDNTINSQDKLPTSAFDLWDSHAVEDVGHRWGMTIDLTTCTGCSACVTACHIENNVSVVGKDEVRRHRDMHWLRIDRYYASDYSLEKGAEEGVNVISSYGKMEDPSENPQTVHMPMMCQHCNHAPCETVCPVAATTHSNEGLNQMTYNRCIGTRYCANNCPYKVRRFNWFNYKGHDKFQNFNPAADSLTRLVLNPDVTVRARGVMEKCSMCVQRIQQGKLDAKKAGEPVQDGSVTTACAESCPSNAITFGDLNDKGSQVNSISENNRSYHALEEIGVKPNIYYMTKVRNVDSH